MEKFNSFLEFELCVQYLCSDEDYMTNRSMLQGLRLSSYETFLRLLRQGGKIEGSIKATNQISKMSEETRLTEEEILDLSKRFRLIILLIDQ